MATLSTFWSHLRGGEFGKIAAALRERIPRGLYHRATAAVFAASPDQDALPEMPAGYRFRQATVAELPALANMIQLPLGEYQRRVAAGDLCYAVFDGERPANLNWVHAGSCYVRGVGCTIPLAADDYYIYGIFTDPRERGKGLYKKALRHLAAELAAKGAARLIQMVEDGNAPVLHTLPRLGYRESYRINHLRLCGMKYTTRHGDPDLPDSRAFFRQHPTDEYWI